MKVKDRAMLVRLRVSSWSGEKLDRKVTNDILIKQAMGNDAGRFNKKLLLPAALRPASQAVRALRDVHTTETLPYDDSHWRMLTTENYFEYIKVTNQAANHLEAMVEQLISGYDRHKQHAREKLLHDMYNEGDYPSPHQIRERFAVDMEFRPVPDHGNFMVDLADDAVESLKGDMEKRAGERLAEAQSDLWRRLLEVTSHFANVMGDEEKRFKDTTVHNVRKIADLVPRLNLNQDPDLDRIANSILSNLNGLNPGQLRENGTVRKEAASQAAAAVDDIQRVMAGAL